MNEMSQEEIHRIVLEKPLLRGVAALLAVVKDRLDVFDVLVESMTDEQLVDLCNATGLMWDRLVGTKLARERGTL